MIVEISPDYNIYQEAVIFLSANYTERRMFIDSERSRVASQEPYLKLRLESGREWENTCEQLDTTRELVS
jgi:hypothetical protein